MPPTTMHVTRRGGSEYARADQTHEYEDVSGLRVVARCAPGASPKVIRVHADYGRRTVSFDTARAGRPPIVPAAGNITVGTKTTDIYLGGTFTLPLPIPDGKGGYGWRVAGTYTYLQVTNRVPGVNAIPTGGLPYPVVPTDQIANQMMLDYGVQVSGDPSLPNPIDTAITAVGAAGVRHDEFFPWPFTALPPQVVTNGLIGG